MEINIFTLEIFVKTTDKLKLPALPKRSINSNYYYDITMFSF